MRDSLSFTTGAPARKKTMFYGWWIVVAGTILNAMSGGTYQNVSRAVGKCTSGVSMTYD